MKAVICPRRAGKSWTAMSYAHDVCLRKPQSVCVIVTLTLKTAKGTYWNTIIPGFQRQFGINCQKHHTDMRITFNNGSILFFVGAESRAEIEKLRGGSYDLVVIDECKSYAPNILEELIQDVLKPATLDRSGVIVMIGTPGSILRGPFYEATYPGHTNSTGKLTSKTYDKPEPYWQKHHDDRSYRWSRHSWTAAENTAIPTIWLNALMDKKKEGWADDHPTWLREYLGQWVASTDAFVYAYASLCHEKPDLVKWEKDLVNGNDHGLQRADDWRYLMGLDFGFEDDFAIVVCAYSLNSGKLFHCFDFKAPHQDVYQIAEHIKTAEKMFGTIDAMVGDAGAQGKMIIETLNRRHGLNIKPADKQNKHDYIELLNADFHSGKVKILPDSDLDSELQMLQWDLSRASREQLVKSGRLKEHSALPNHLCDALLYLWRYSYHTFGSRAVGEVTKGTPEWFAKWEAESIARLDNPEPERTLWAELRRNSVDPLSGWYQRYE